jgi:hypothetical protein
MVIAIAKNKKKQIKFKWNESKKTLRIDVAQITVPKNN